MKFDVPADTNPIDQLTIVGQPADHVPHEAAVRVDHDELHVLT